MRVQILSDDQPPRLSFLFSSIAEARFAASAAEDYKW